MISRAVFIPMQILAFLLVLGGSSAKASLAANENGLDVTGIAVGSSYPSIISDSDGKNGAKNFYFEVAGYERWIRLSFPGFPMLFTVLPNDLTKYQSQVNAMMTAMESGVTVLKYYVSESNDYPIMYQLTLENLNFTQLSAYKEYPQGVYSSDPAAQSGGESSLVGIPVQIVRNGTLECKVLVHISGYTQTSGQISPQTALLKTSDEDVCLYAEQAAMSVTPLTVKYTGELNVPVNDINENTNTIIRSLIKTEF